MDPEENRDYRKKSIFAYTTSEIVLLAVLGVVFGVANVFLGALPQWGGALLGPLFSGLLGGFVQISQVLGGYIVRRPGAATLTMMINVAVNFSLGTQQELFCFRLVSPQGFGAELAFMLFGYKRFDLLVMMLAGGLASVGSQLMFLVFFTWDPSTGPYIASVAIAFVAGMIEAGIVAYLLAKALERTGLISNIMRQSSR